MQIIYKLTSWTLARLNKTSSGYISFSFLQNHKLQITCLQTNVLDLSSI